MNVIVNSLKNQIYHIHSDIIKFRKELGINDQSMLLVIIYLINQNIPVLYDPNKISQSLSLTAHEVLEAIHNAKENSLIKIDIVSKNNKKQEYLDVTPLYEKLSNLYQDNQKESDHSNLFETFEKEFARTLSPMEYEIINSWINSKMDKELIIAALKEAIFNGVTNLRYIDKILYEWNKAGFKKVTDIKKKKPEIKKEELFDYNWLEE